MPALSRALLWRDFLAFSRGHTVRSIALLFAIHIAAERQAKRYGIERDDDERAIFEAIVASIPADGPLAELSGNPTAH